MPEPLKPALTPEEWKGDGYACHEIHPGRLSVVDDGGATTFDMGESCLSLVGRHRHAAAALCLHGQPFGFTREDVSVLRQLPTFVRGLGLGPDPDGVAAYLPGLADRIEALLPPEAP